MISETVRGPGGGVRIELYFVDAVEDFRVEGHILPRNLSEISTPFFYTSRTY
jgi:hypothetical protein